MVPFFDADCLKRARIISGDEPIESDLRPPFLTFDVFPGRRGEANELGVRSTWLKNAHGIVPRWKDQRRLAPLHRLRTWWTHEARKEAPQIQNRSQRTRNPKSVRTLLNFSRAVPTIYRATDTRGLNPRASRIAVKGGSGRRKLHADEYGRAEPFGLVGNRHPGSNSAGV
jgi:hypothetical protein